MDEECEICGKEDVLCDVVYEQRPMRVCSYCKTLPDMILIEKPSEEKLNRIYQRYTFSARAKQEIQDRKSSLSASSPINFRGYTLDELRKKRAEKEAQEKKQESAQTNPEAVSEEDVDFKPKDIRIKGLQELKEEFDSA